MMTTAKDIDNRDQAAQIQYLEARVEALHNRVVELEAENMILRQQQDWRHKESLLERIR